jgi:tRNA threonylcarbamoyladenosine biosynthesis protein TsaE
VHAEEGPWTTAGPEETRRLGRALAARLAPDGVLLLSGGLGAGKTVLAQGVAAGLGIPAEEVQSPTYTLIREHRGPGGRLVHLDLYRLEAAEALAAGVEEALAAPGVKVVEWAERLPFAVPGALWLTIATLPGGGREFRKRKGPA